MKRLVLSLSAMLSLTVNAQDYTKETIKLGGNVLVSVYQLNVMDDVDTVKCAILYYRNGQYTALVDNAHIKLCDKESAQEMADNLREAVAKSTEKTTAVWKTEGYKIESSYKAVRISNDSGQWVTMRPSYVEKIAVALESYK